MVKRGKREEIYKMSFPPLSALLKIFASSTPRYVFPIASAHLTLINC